jgi:hypothetical protein
MTRSLASVVLASIALGGAIASLGCGASTTAASVDEDAGLERDGGEADASVTTDSGAVVRPDGGRDAGADGGGAGAPDAAVPIDAAALALPPAAPPSGAPSATRRVFAVSKWFLGETFRDGGPSANAWKTFGYDLDGVATRTSRTGTCRAIASGVVVLDGDQGVDNSFGQNGLPVLQRFTSPSDLSAVTTAEVSQGGSTLLLDIIGLDDTQAQSAIGLTGQAFIGAKRSTAPRFDGTDEWPLDGAYLVDRTNIARGSSFKFPASYVTGGVWVSGPRSDLTVVLPMQGATLTLKLRNAVVTAKHAAGSMLATGTIAGVVPIAEFTSAMSAVVSRLDRAACPGTSLSYQLRDICESNADIRLAGPDPTKDCDAISVGIGFEAKPIRVPTTVAPAAPPPADPCAR